MKKLVLIFVFASCSVFSYGIYVPGDSIQKFVQETAIKNGLKNPDSLVVGQELMFYFGHYIKIPYYIVTQKGDNLTRLTMRISKDMSCLEQENRNLAYEMFKTQETIVTELPTSVNQKSAEVKTPGVVWIFIVCFVIFLFFVKLLYQLFNKKNYPYKYKLRDWI